MDDATTSNNDNNDSTANYGKADLSASPNVEKNEKNDKDLLRNDNDNDIVIRRYKREGCWNRNLRKHEPKRTQSAICLNVCSPSPPERQTIGRVST